MSETRVNAAVAKLLDAQRAKSSLLSAGIEPCAEYLVPGFDPTPAGYRDFFREFIAATRDHVCAYKFNLAFFEALGRAGGELLYDVRAMVPDDVLVIADAKRGDIGSTAKHYAHAIYGEFAADATTVSPLLGRDSVEPFLAWSDRLTFVLALTSNPGAEDFLLRDDLGFRIAERVLEWDTNHCAGFVAGATRPELLARLRALAPHAPLLIPGLGAQAGDLAATMAATRAGSADAPVVLHVTRGLFPAEVNTANPFAIIQAAAKKWNRKIAAASAP